MLWQCIGVQPWQRQCQAGHAFVHGTSVCGATVWRVTVTHVMDAQGKITGELPGLGK